MLYGRQVHQSVSVGEIGGFLASSEILEITKWIKSNKIETFEGFSKMYDGLSIEVKKELEEMLIKDLMKATSVSRPKIPINEMMKSVSNKKKSQI